MPVRVVIGNPRAGGRTSTLGEAVGRAVAGARGGDQVVVHELADVASHVFEWGHEDVAALGAQLASADVNIFASPTFKATYTGLLKAFLDNYGDDALAGTRAVPVMIGGNPAHALAPEVHLRPLLVELGASVPTRGLYVLASTFDQLDELVASWLEKAGPLLAG